MYKQYIHIDITIKTLTVKLWFSLNMFYKIYEGLFLIDKPK